MCFGEAVVGRQVVGEGGHGDGEVAVTHGTRHQSESTLRLVDEVVESGGVRSQQPVQVGSKYYFSCFIHNFIFRLQETDATE